MTARVFRSIPLALLLVTALFSPSPAFQLRVENLAAADRADDPLDDEEAIEPLLENVALDFDVQVFGSKGPGVQEAARERLEALLRGRVDSIDRICGLSPAQRKKVDLAGHGDIERLFDRVEEQRRKYQLIASAGPNIVVRKFGNRVFQEVRDPKLDAIVQRVRRDAYPMQSAVAAGPFDDGSIFSKCLASTLKPDQAARYAAMREVERAGGQFKLSSSAGALADYEINLVGTRFGDEELAPLRRLTNIRSLVLDGTSITDAGLAHLEGMVDLEVLDLARTQVTSRGLAHVEGLTNLQRLDLKSTRVDDAGIAYLKRMTRLNHLYLFGTRVTDAGLLHLISLQNLESLFLGELAITDAGIARLTGLKNLRRLTVNGTRITDAGLARLGGLARLEMLDLRNTGVTDVGISQLKKLPALQHIAVDGTRVTAAGIAELRGALPDLEVDTGRR